MREYRTADKSSWGPGPWQDEPDKVQWVDEASGLDCLAVRGPGGHFCGYVGVVDGHPLFGIDSPDALLEVHGGLTFADFCHEPAREAWEKWRRGMKSAATQKEAAAFPRGDSANRLRELGHLVDDFEAWREHGIATFICHVPEEGRPARVWWFGFDCAHAGDYSPKFDADTKDFLPQPSSFSHRSDNQYRDLNYVRAQCVDLARQLAAVPA